MVAPGLLAIIDPKAIYLFKKLEDYNAGINTVGFTTINTGGIHKFREYDARNVISEIKVIKPGSGYENRTLNVKPAGISTTFAPNVTTSFSGLNISKIVVLMVTYRLLLSSMMLWSSNSGMQLIIISFPDAS